jgi:outer membrane protein TolC
MIGRELRMRRAWWTILCLVAASGAVFAQQPVLKLTLDNAIARGLENSHRLAELQARSDAAEASESGRRAARMPTVALVGGYTRTNHVDEFAISQPGQPPRVIYPDIPDNVRARVDLQWPIYSGGRIDALERAAHAERQATVADLAAARLDLRLEITRAFWALVTARATEQVLARSVGSIDAHVRDLASRLEQGLIPPNELLSAQAQLSRQRVLAIEARNTAAIAEADLQRLLGIDNGNPLEPAAALDAPGASVAAVAALVDEARQRRPERQALAHRVEATSARGRASDAASRPQVTFDGGYDYARPNARIFPRSGDWRDSWDLSVNVSWSLWDGGRRGAERAEAAANVRAAQSRAADLDRQLTFEVRQRWLEVDSNRMAIGAAEDGVRSAAEARRVIVERFGAGVATSTDVVDADVALLQAELDRTRALAGARLAEARLERAIGHP